MCRVKPAVVFGLLSSALPDFGHNQTKAAMVRNVLMSELSIINAEQHQSQIHFDDSFDPVAEISKIPDAHFAHKVFGVDTFSGPFVGFRKGVDNHHASIAEP